MHNGTDNEIRMTDQEQGNTESELAAVRPATGKAAGDRPKRSGIMAALAAAGALTLKFLKPLLIGLKALKFGAVLKTGLTMILCMWTYAMLWGWQFGVAFVLLIFVHEMGHAYALRQFGVRSSVPVFIPFVGAFIAMKEMPKNAVVEAWTGIAGPIVGTAGATLCWSAGLYTGNPFWYAVAYTGFFLNLFNMIPLSPLDGGRTVAAISPKLWIVGFIAVLVMLFRSPNPILFVILFLAGRNLYNLWRNRNQEQEEYYQVDRNTKLQISLCYFGLLIFLGIGMSLTHASI